MPPSTFHHRTAALAAALAAGLLGGCTSLTDTSGDTNRYGAVSIMSRNVSATEARGWATMVIFDASSVSIPNSMLQQSDQCVYASVDTSSTGPRGQLRGGETIGMTVGEESHPMPFSPLFSRYETPGESPFSYSAGDTANITIPGDAAGFPASTIAVKLAEPLVPEDVPELVAGEPLAIRWNGTGDPSAAIIVSLRYAGSPNATYANEQIYCALVDDGAHDIPPGGVAAMLASPSNFRSLTLTRWRTNEKVLNDRTLLHIVSTIDTTVAVP